MDVAQQSQQPHLAAMAEALRSTQLRLSDDRERAVLLQAIEQTLAPSTDEESAPTAVAIVGLTGTGKSTILNSLAQKKVSEVGLIRPTTTTAVMWAHRRNAGRYWSDFMAQVKDQVDDSVELVLTDDELLDTLTMIDTVAPTDDRPEAMASLAELVVAVTSASRYADASHWDLLGVARRRGVPMLFVLNRVPDRPGVAEKVVDHYAEMLAERGFIPAPDRKALFVVYEQGIQTTNEGLPEAAVAGLRKELEALADFDLRDGLMDRSSQGALRDFAQSGAALAAVVRSEAGTANRLILISDKAYARAVRELDEELREGRHQSVRVSTKSGNEQMAHAFTRRAGIGAQLTADGWSQDADGSEVLDGSDIGLWRHGLETDDYATEVVQGWVAQVQALAIERSKRGRMSRRRRKKVTVMLVDLATQPEGVDLPKKLERFYGQNGSVAVVRAVRELLTEAMADVGRFDAMRFREVLGEPSQLLALAKTLEDHGSQLVEDIAT